jgi:hypothetical protein
MIVAIVVGMLQLQNTGNISHNEECQIDVCLYNYVQMTHC